MMLRIPQNKTLENTGAIAWTNSKALQQMANDIAIEKYPALLCFFQKNRSLMTCRRLPLHR
jgi:hypothetical protein